LAYPLVQLPLWRDLKSRLMNEYACQYAGAPGPACMARHVDGVLRTYPVTFLRDADRVSLTVLRSILRHLRIPPSDFGLPLG